MGTLTEGPDARILAGTRLMVLEDEFVILRQVAIILADAGADAVAACRKVEHALDAVDQGGLSAAVLDVQIGRADSTPVARALHRRGIPFLFYSGHAAGDPVRAAWPACPVIGKPARPRTLVAAVAALIGR